MRICGCDSNPLQESIIMKFTAVDALELPVAERIQLVADIWDSIGESPEKIELTEATRQLLRQRLAAHKANPAAGSPWHVVRQRIVSE
jgi:putative addiction module component (TIGR02574 family)